MFKQTLRSTIITILYGTSVRLY